MSAGTLFSVNVGRPRAFEYQGRPAESAIWKSPVEGRVAVRGVNLEGDDQARQAAEDFVRSEQGLRQNWQKHQNRSDQNSGGLFGFAPNASSGSSLPPQWVHHLIQSGGDDYLRIYRSRLPDELAKAADRFVIARRDLFELSR